MIQQFLDAYLANKAGAVIDYIHDEEELYSLCADGKTSGFLYGCMGKSELFDAIEKEGVLPRKTFSMGSDGTPEAPAEEATGGQAEDSVPVENYFATAVIDRERARGEALEVLVNITEDETASETAKTEAFTQMERIANETSWEIDIENLVKAKGFDECVAIINEDCANIVVGAEALTPGQIAQIKEIVYLESSIEPKDVKIIEKTAS